MDQARTPNPLTLAAITRELLGALNRFPRKSLGQHFLVDPQVLERILNAAEITKEDLIIEVGSGLGVITAEIAKRAGHVIAIEIDQELIRASKEVLKDFTNVTFVESDFLKVDLDDLLKDFSDGEDIAYKVIGNLPYYITTPIIEKLFGARNRPEVAVLMMQKEVAQRMVEKPGTKTYGALSVFVQFHATVELNSLVSKSSFYPWPEVSSAVVVLRPHHPPKYKVPSERLFLSIVHAAFQQRRKQIRNSLEEFMPEIEKAGIDPNRRPETLSVEEFVQIANG